MTKPGFYLIFGEDPNDTMAIERLLPVLLGGDRIAGSKAMRHPVVLSRNAHREKRRGVSETISGFAKGFEENGRRVIVVAHRDCDACEPAHVEESRALEEDLRRHGVKRPVAATPAWEIEAWWMLFPNAVANVRKCWTKLNYGRSNVGAIVNAKERLVEDLRPKGRQAKGRCPDYTEADGPAIAAHIAADPSCLQSIESHCESFSAFCRRLKEVSESDPR